MNTSEKLENYVLPTYGRFPIELSHGKGTEVWDTNDKRYLDFCTGIAVCSLGHSHPVLTQTIKDQADKLLHCSNLYHIPQQAELARTIVEDGVKSPGKVFFSNSGAEANDGLIKSARRFGHETPKADGSPRFEILSFKNSFHGRTMGSMFATGQDIVHDRFAPIPHGYRYLPYNDVEAIKAGITKDTVAILLEPVQGEGGVHPATKEFLAAVQEVCKQHNLLLFFDEVQAGFGRCGEMMAWNAINPDVHPDGISWAKGMGGGVPIGAFWLSDRLVGEHNVPFSSLMGAKSHGSTYGGNPLVTAVSLACIQTVIAEDLCNKVKNDEAYIRKLVADWNHPAINELRGIGLLLGFGLNADTLKVPEGQTAALALCLKLNDLGLLTVPAGADTLRWLPPLNVSKAHIDEAFTLLQQAITELSA